MAEDFVISAIENVKKLYREVEKWQTAEKTERAARNQLAIYNECLINERDKFKLDAQYLRDQLKLATAEIATLTAKLKELELKNISDRRQSSLENYKREYLRRQRTVCDCPMDNCVTDGPDEDEIDG